MTRQRALILEILQHSPKHLTADEIFAIAREKMPGIARGTVYRNLKLMEQAREIARLEMPDGPDRFDKTSNPHGHLYCDCCGSLQDLPVIYLRFWLSSCRTSLAVSALRIMRYCLREHSFLFCHHAPKRQKGCRTALQMSRTGDIL